MTEKSNKRNRNTPRHPNQTSTIDENWQKFLASNLMKVRDEKSPDKKEQYNGIFRRARKKNADILNSVQNLNITINNNTESQNGVSVCNRERKFELTKSTAVSNTNIMHNIRKQPQNQITKYIAIDCEMVGVGFQGGDHMLARVSLVNKFGGCIYDKYVKPREEVVDYRTQISGIRKEDLLTGEDFTVVQKEVANIIKGRVIVGHSLKNDLSVLFLSHPKRHIRDTSRYKPFKKITKGCTPSLKRLAKEILGISIQEGEHSSVEDAKAAMQLYCTVSKTWEQTLSQKRGYSKTFAEA